MNTPRPARFRAVEAALAAAALALAASLHAACNSSGGSSLAGREWRAPELVAADNLAGPPPINAVAAIVSTGEVVAAWETSSFPITIAGTRWEAGAGWGSVVPLSNAGPGDAVVPRVAADNGGNAMVAWYQDNGTRNDIWVRRFSGGFWDSARTIGDNLGDAVRVSIAMDPSGRAVAVWHQYDGTFNSIWSNRYVPGSGWVTAETIETANAGDAVDAQAAMTAGGDAVAVWSQTDSFRYSIRANRYRAGAGWDCAVLIETDDAGDADQPQVAMDPSGNTVAVWRQFDGTRFNIVANRYRAGVGWDCAVLIETDDAGDANRPQVAVDPSGNAIAVWRQSDGTRFNIVANRYRAGVGWDCAALIETDDAGDADRPQVAVDPSGNAIGVWQQSDGTNVTIRSNRYVPGVGWGAAKRIDADGPGTAERPGIAMDRNGNAVAVWTWSDGTTYKVRAARYR